jgi:hypothetical protein
MDRLPGVPGLPVRFDLADKHLALRRCGYVEGKVEQVPFGFPRGRPDAEAGNSPECFHKGLREAAFQISLCHHMRHFQHSLKAIITLKVIAVRGRSELDPQQQLNLPRGFVEGGERGKARAPAPAAVQRHPEALRIQKRIGVVQVGVVQQVEGVGRRVTLKRSAAPLSHQLLCQLAGLGRELDRCSGVGFVEQIPRSPQGVLVPVGYSHVDIRTELSRQNNQPLHLGSENFGEPALFECTM